MKKLMASLIFGTALLSTLPANAEDIKKLPLPDLTQKSAPLMELLNTRESGRSYDKQKQVDDKVLSEILWAAYGINQNGRRTIPTARNLQNMKVFVLNQEGIWFYNAKDNQLEKISSENAIHYTETQPFVADAPVHLIYTSSDEKWGGVHAGSAYQNVYLYATANGLNTVIRGLIDFDGLKKALKLGKDEFVIAHQTVGYAK